ncbi:hypothetical protein KP509_12G096200 [Ceratopteris richardii]|uniref:Uncharacterized protein n=1 Tax=Ceratopteris richardii TaxID=49495 RepID=A0A8T2TS31_CERRI|nr:hypothetical protein KP509_12G096200 [Ceratopteris richardii]
MASSSLDLSFLFIHTRTTESRKGPLVAVEDDRMQQRALIHFQSGAFSFDFNRVIRCSEAAASAACRRFNSFLSCPNSASFSRRHCCKSSSTPPKSSLSSPLHQNNPAENPQPYSLQQTTSQRHEKMEKREPVDPMTERSDHMEESYGEGYATRSSEEGFGGIYAFPSMGATKAEEKKAARTSARDQKEEESQQFDHTQGSPVAEKEKGTRHGGAGFTGANKPN